MGGIREWAYKEQSKKINESLECKKLSDARRFINSRLNYLEKKAINELKITLFSDFNDKKWEE